MTTAYLRLVRRLAPASLDGWAALCLLLCGPAYLFIRHFHIAILDPTNIAWLMQHDWGQHALGMHAFLHDGWSWPLTRTGLFFPPEGAAIALTDSNPLIALPLKLFAWALPDDFQIIGPWLLACVFLQAWIGYLLLRPHAARSWIAALAALFFCVWPPLYFRMDHDTLVAHWVLLLGLWIYVTPADARARLLRMTGLLALAASVHAMLFMMAAAFWSAEALRLGWATWRARPRWPDLAAMALVPPLAGIAMFVLLGTLPGGVGGSWGFGEYSMNLNAPINPKDDWGSMMLPALDMGRFQYEGYAYFGVGLFLLFIFAIAASVLSRRNAPAPPAVDPVGRPALGWLIAPLAACMLLALSTTVRLGDMILIDIALSDHMRSEVLGPVRASGRFFWPVAYVVIFLALRAVLKQPPPRAAAMMALALAVQHADLAIYSAAQKNRTGLADELSGFRKASDPVWDEMLRHADRVVFLPARVPEDRTFFYELSWRAFNHDASVNTMYMSRLNEAQKSAQDETVRRWSKLGPEARTLYVFSQGCTRYAKGRDGLRRVEGVLIRPPNAAQDVLDRLPEETCR